MKTTVVASTLQFLIVTLALSQVPTNGLVAYYPFNGNANDASGNLRHGVVYGATLTADRFGSPNRAYSFNGSTQYIEIPDTSNALTFDAKTESYTVCLWVKLANVQSVMVPIVDRGSVHGPVSYTIQSRPSEGFFFNLWNNIPNGDCSLLSTTKPTANRWYFLAMTVQSQQFTIYVDGNMEGTRAVRSDFSTTKNESKARTIGRMMEQNSDYVNGIIDDISIYNRALSQTEIQAMYTQVPTNGLVAYYPFNGNANDASGNLRHGVVYGATLTADRFGSPNRAYSFNGSTQYIEIPDTSNALTFDAKTESYTVCLWVKLANVQSVMVPIVDRGSVHGPVSYTIQSRPSEGFFFNLWNNIPNGDCSLLSTTKPTANRWYFLAMTVQSQQFTIYVDGNMEGTRAVRSDFSTTKNESKARTIGRMMEQNSDYVNGIIDDISIYNRALSQTEIQAMYTQVAPTGVEVGTISVPTHCSLDQNYPNPFNPSTTIRFGLPVRSHVTLTVFNILGQQMAQLVDENEGAGYHEVRFDASGLSSGAYFYRIQAGDFVQTRRLLLLR